MNESASQNSLVISYLTLRKIVGVLGLLLPIILVSGSFLTGNCTAIQESISNYYHTNMGDIFVGVLCAVSLFLFSYTGYTQTDNRAANLAGIFGLGVAFFPTTPISPLPFCNIPASMHCAIFGKIHLLSAGLFFLVLAYFSLVLFTKGAGTPTPQKIKRNRVYKICGYIMLACILLLLLHKTLTPFPQQYKPVFVFETIALWAFGISWLIKGEFLLKDEAGS